MNNREMYEANDPDDYLRRDIVRVGWHVDCYDWDIPEMVATYANKFGNDELYEAIRIFSIHNYIDLQDEALDVFIERIKARAKEHLETKAMIARARLDFLTVEPTTHPWAMNK